MSVAAPVRPVSPPPPVAQRPPAPPPPEGSRLDGLRARAPLAARLATFAALAAFASAHAALFVARPPAVRLLLVVAIATAGGAALALLRPRGRLAAFALRSGISVLTVLAALVAMGLPVRLLLPRGWDRLAEGIDRGLAGVPMASWPYSGPDDWIRLVLLLLVPLVVGLAAVLAFAPTRRLTGPGRAGALVLLIALYALPVTERTLSAEPARGLALLALVGLWLWLPRLRPRDALAGGLALLAAGLIAVPAAGRLEQAPGWVDYESWSVWTGGAGRAASFDWSHSYGPIDWPRDGRTLLSVRSPEPHYWRVQALDRFDGFGWVRSQVNDRRPATAELPPVADLENRWEKRIGVTVRNMRSAQLVAAGTPLEVRGAGALFTSADGTSELLDGGLSEGDSYTVDAYVPDPSAAQMRAAVAPPPPDLQRQYTEIVLPRPGQTATERPGAPGDASRSAALPPAPVSMSPAGPGLGTDPAAEQRIARSPYARVLRLARRVTAGQATVYDQVRAVERHLRETYRYSERPPARPYPLDAFLFQDRIGYCQQFSGAMALMLRMKGIAARPAAGFSPGTYDERRKEYRVRDLDAHSWVEVYFAGIGWVPFDPTPAAAPAQGQSSDAEDIDLAPSASRGAAPGGGRAGLRDRVADAGGDSGGVEAGEGGGPPWMLPAALLVLAGIAAAVVRAALRRRGPRRRDGRALGATDPEVAELRGALTRLGYDLPPGTTLAALEGRLSVLAGPAAARQVRRLRERRYAAPTPAGRRVLDRRALRRALTAGGGPLTRLRGWVALPPRLAFRRRV